MTVLVTGSSGHLGEGLMRVLAPRTRVGGLDLLAGAVHDASSARWPTARSSAGRSPASTP